MADPTAAPADNTHAIATSVAAFLAPFIVAFLAKYGISVDTTQVMTALGVAAAALGGALWNQIHARSVAAAQAKASTPAAAAADLAKGAA